jgi:hypothetical protein
LGSINEIRYQTKRESYLSYLVGLRQTWTPLSYEIQISVSNREWNCGQFRGILCFELGKVLTQALYLQISIIEWNTTTTSTMPLSSVFTNLTDVSCRAQQHTVFPVFRWAQFLPILNE